MFKYTFSGWDLKDGETVIDEQELEFERDCDAIIFAEKLTKLFKERGHNPGYMSDRKGEVLVGDENAFF